MVTVSMLSAIRSRDWREYRIPGENGESSGGKMRKRGEGVGSQTFASHGNGVGNTDGVVLPRQHVLLLDGLLHDLPQFQD